MRDTKTAQKVITPQMAIDAMKEFTLAKNRIAEISNKKAMKVAAIDSQFADDLRSCEEIVKSKQAELETYATSNPDLFAETKSIDLMYGTIGYSKNPAAVVIEDGHKEEQIVTTLRANATLVGLVAVKYSLDKSAIKKAIAADEKLAGKLAKLHITVEQQEVFFVKSKAA